MEILRNNKFLIYFLPSRKSALSLKKILQTIWPTFIEASSKKVLVFGGEKVNAFSRKRQHKFEFQP
jgi:hypothetical protein